MRVQRDGCRHAHPSKNNPAALLALGWFEAGNGRKKRYGGAAIQRQSAAVRSLLATVGDGIAGRGKRLDGQIVTKELLSMKQNRPINAYSSGCAKVQPFLADPVLEDRQVHLRGRPGVTSGDYLSGLVQRDSKGSVWNQRDSDINDSSKLLVNGRSVNYSLWAGCRSLWVLGECVLSSIWGSWSR